MASLEQWTFAAPIFQKPREPQSLVVRMAASRKSPLRMAIADRMLASTAATSSVLSSVNTATW